ncbi:hypothetical protein NPIL_392451 [Nephila pilipes]|uniref:Uncharacterized protein n=1 Tax=Nephila pilipes TaxID=299642 RepID=A0A8X6TEE7_NEPPI|nr:hypothetical protein NPIL_392451 [Nephila pilipes]
MCASTSENGLLRTRLGASPLSLTQDLFEKRFLCFFSASLKSVIGGASCLEESSSSSGRPLFSLLLSRLCLWDSSVQDFFKDSTCLKIV